MHNNSGMTGFVILSNRDQDGNIETDNVDVNASPFIWDNEECEEVSVDPLGPEWGAFSLILTQVEFDSDQGPTIICGGSNISLKQNNAAFIDVTFTRSSCTVKTVN